MSALSNVSSMTSANNKKKTLQLDAAPSSSSAVAEGQPRGLTDDKEGGRRPTSSKASSAQSKLSQRIKLLEEEIQREHQAHQQTRQDLLRTANEVEMLRAVVESRRPQNVEAKKSKAARHVTIGSASTTSTAKIPAAPVATKNEETLAAQAAEPNEVDDSVKSCTGRSSTILTTSSLYIRSI